MWIREISNTGANIQTLHKAEQEIIRTGTPLKILEVCEIIKNCKETLVLPPKTKCNYCDSKGYVIGLLFDNSGTYTGYEAALNCVCGNARTMGMLTMFENSADNHKTYCRDGYYRIFPTIVEKFAYLDKVYANGNYDLRR